MEIKADIITKPGNYENELKLFIEKQASGSVFQHIQMFHFLHDQENMDPYFIIIRENGKIAGTLLLYQVSHKGGIKEKLTRRTMIFGDPVIDEEQSNKGLIMDRILSEADEIAGSANLFTQFRLFSNEILYPAVFEEHGYRIQKRINTLIPVTGKEENFRRLSKSKQRQLRKSINKGARIIRAEDHSYLEQFYKILCSLYQEKIRKPLSPFSFFESFLDYSNQGKLGVILLVEYQGKITGGIVCPVTPGKCIYEWYICGMDREYNKEGIYPSVMATWAAIDYASENNIPEFDLMGMGKPGIPYGVRDFKLRFGGEKVPYYRYNKINNKLLYEIAELGYNVKRWLS